MFSWGNWEFQKWSGSHWPLWWTLSATCLTDFCAFPRTDPHFCARAEIPWSQEGRPSPSPKSQWTYSPLPGIGLGWAREPFLANDMSREIFLHGTKSIIRRKLLAFLVPSFSFGKCVCEDMMAVLWQASCYHEETAMEIKSQSFEDGGARRKGKTWFMRYHRTAEPILNKCLFWASSHERKIGTCYSFLFVDSTWVPLCILMFFLSIDLEYFLLSSLLGVLSL